MDNPARGLLICTTIFGYLSNTTLGFSIQNLPTICIVWPTRIIRRKTEIHMLIILFALKYGILGIFTRSDTKDTKACLQENTIIHNRNIKISIHEL